MEGFGAAEAFFDLLYGYGTAIGQLVNDNIAGSSSAAFNSTALGLLDVFRQIDLGLFDICSTAFHQLENLQVYKLLNY